MRNICSTLMQVIFVFAVFALSGCSVHSVRLVHGMPFAEIEDIVQSRLQRGMPMEDAVRVAEVDWSMSKAKTLIEYREDAWYSLEPIVSSSFLSGEHRSALHLVSDDKRLIRVVYVNHWMMDDVPHGKTEIHLSEATP